MRSGARPLVLLLGLDRYLLDACLRRGVDAVVACGPQSWDNGFIEVPGQVTLLRVDSSSNPEAVLAALYRAGFSGRQFDAVQTTDEFSLVTAALLAKQLNSGGLDPAVALHFRDKSLQKARVAGAGVKTARFTVIDDVFDTSGLTDLPYQHAVLKPIAGAGTVATSTVDSLDELSKRSGEYRRQRIPQRTFLLEEYVPGEEWLADGVVFDGELLFTALGKYSEPLMATVAQGLAVTLRRFDPESEAWAYEKAHPVIAQSLSALGMRSGVFHMELFHDAETGSVTFGECAWRRGGGLIHEEVQAKFNVHLGECALQCALGQRPDLNIKRRAEIVGTGYLLGKPGFLVRCPTPIELTELPGVKFARIPLPYGTHLEEGVASTAQHLGQVLLTADSEQQLSQRLAEVRAWFNERVNVIPENVPNRDLRAWQRSSWPDDNFRDSLYL